MEKTEIRSIWMRRIVAVLLMALILVVLLPHPDTSAAAAKPLISGAKNVVITKSTQKSTTKAPTQTLKLQNVSTNTYSITWTTSDPKIVKLPSKTANKTSIKVTPYYKKGSATITATYTHKKTKKKNTLRAVIRVYQGATSIDIKGSDGTNLKSKTINIDVDETLALNAKAQPTSIDATGHKVIKWSVSPSELGKMKGNIFYPNTQKIIGRGNRTATVSAYSEKNRSNAQASTTVCIRGGEINVSPAVDTKNNFITVGTTIPLADLASPLKGSVLTLRANDNSGKTLTANFDGPFLNSGIVKYKLNQEPDDKYNGSYTASINIDGLVYANSTVEYYSTSYDPKQCVKGFTVHAGGNSYKAVQIQDNYRAWTVELPAGFDASTLTAENLEVEFTNPVISFVDRLRMVSERNMWSIVISTIDENGLMLVTDPYRVFIVIADGNEDPDEDPNEEIDENPIDEDPIGEDPDEEIEQAFEQIELAQDTNADIALVEAGEVVLPE